MLSVQLGRPEALFVFGDFNFRLDVHDVVKVGLIQVSKVMFRATQPGLLFSDSDQRRNSAGMFLHRRRSHSTAVFQGQSVLR